jgi:ATP-dependent Clp protease adapter protein ClpS
MFSPLKLIVAVVIALRMGILSSAFVPYQVAPLSARSVQVNEMRSVGSLYIALAPAAPTKNPDLEIIQRSDSDEMSAKEPMWLVRLYNDPMNKREFVARCLVEICGLNDGMAFSVMMQAHQNGLSVIGKYVKEVAELYKERLQGEGLFVDMVPAEDEEG